MKRRCPDCNGDADASTDNTLSHDETCWIGKGLDLVVDNDIKWFQERPKEDFRIRKARKVELITMNLNTPAMVKVGVVHNRCCLVKYIYTKSKAIGFSVSYCNDITEEERLTHAQYISQLLSEQKHRYLGVYTK